jgi:hypothetical protein
MQIQKEYRKWIKNNWKNWKSYKKKKLAINNKIKIIINKHNK